VVPLKNQLYWGLAICFWIAAPAVCFCQFTPQLPYPPQGIPQQNTVYPQSGYSQPPSSVPMVWGQPVPSYGMTSPYGSTGIPTTPQTFGQPTFPTSVYPNSSPGVLYPSVGQPPSNSAWYQPSPYLANPYQANPYQANPYQANPYQPNPYGYSPYNSDWNNMLASTGNNISSGTDQVIRLCQGPRFRHTWLNGTNAFKDRTPNSLQTNDTDVSLVFAIPNFLNSTRPLYIIPSYSQHEWDGPTTGTSDLPGSAFSGFLDSGWETNPQQTLGTELALRVGVFSAFDAVNSNSIRIQGKALGKLRLTPTSTMRAGVFYLDRNKIKLLPAFGLLWTPNKDTRFDLFFPEPKLAHYVATLGNSDMWWYLSGYYGGGAWTINQTDGSPDEIDINDIRLTFGFEFGKSDQIRQGYRLGFIEAGYAFNRELLYRVRSASNLNLEDSFVLRAGFKY
jgi:hypothetical protein